MDSCDAQHYLLCLDSSKASKVAMARGLCIARPIDVLTVFTAYPAKMEAEAEEILKEAQKSLLRGGNICRLNFEKKETEDPNAAILQKAQDSGVTTIVMGRSGTGEASQIGSTSSHVVACATCSVLVVR